MRTTNKAVLNLFGKANNFFSSKLNIIFTYLIKKPFKFIGRGVCQLKKAFFRVEDAAIAFFAWTTRGVFKFIHGIFEGLHEINLSIKERRFWVGKGPYIASAILFSMLLFSITFYTVGIRVEVGGSTVGYVRSQQQYLNIVNSVEKKASSVTGRPFKINSDVRYQFEFILKRDFTPSADLEQALLKNVSDLANMYVLKVDGDVVAANSSYATINQTLDEYKQDYKSGDEKERVEFVNDVQITYEVAPSELYMSAADIKERMHSAKDEPRTYIVKSGESALDVAIDNHVSLDYLTKVNPGVNLDNLKSGQKINLTDSDPVLSVKTIKVETYNETIPFKTENINTDSLYKSQSQIKRYGKNGTARVEAEVEYLNGKEISRKVLTYTVVQEPVSKQVLVGTKALPPKAPTGTFRWPVSGTITSRFGRRWGGYHTGIDIAVRTGTQVHASDGGTVTYAGYNGNYGYLVKIQHWNGYETYYAHNSKLLVKKGQSVAKGEVIARSGNTGRSTGPHVHFEIRRYGVALNPLNYLK